MPTEIRCPHCRAETRWEGNLFRPFCSERCKLQDLGAWALGKYAIPSDHSTPSDSFSKPDSGEEEPS